MQTRTIIALRRASKLVAAREPRRAVELNVVVLSVACMYKLDDSNRTRRYAQRTRESTSSWNDRVISISGCCNTEPCPFGTLLYQSIDQRVNIKIILTTLVIFISLTLVCSNSSSANWMFVYCGVLCYFYRTDHRLSFLSRERYFGSYLARTIYRSMTQRHHCVIRSICQR